MTIFQKFKYRFMTYLSQRPHLSYSMAGEDRILSHILKHHAGNKKISFVNIGAAHPIFLNDTYYLVKKLRREGKYGICVSVDPRPDLALIWKILRRKDIFLNVIVSNSESSEFFFNPLDSHNSSSNEKWAAGLANTHKSESSTIKYQPEVMKLSGIFEKYELGIFNGTNNIYSVLIIDVEGLEFDVVQSNTWKKYQPDLIMIEICFPYTSGLRDFTLDLLRDSQTHVFLTTYGYTYYGGNGYSHFYLRKKDLIY